MRLLSCDQYLDRIGKEDIGAQARSARALANADR